MTRVQNATAFYLDVYTYSLYDLQIFVQYFLKRKSRTCTISTTYGPRKRRVRCCRANQTVEDWRVSCGVAGVREYMR